MSLVPAREGTALNGRLLEWRETPFHPDWADQEPDAVIWIEVQRFDAAWRRSGEWISPGGAGGQDDRYRRFGEWVVGAKPIEMCCIWLREAKVGFTNGRHRFAWLRDHGVVFIPVQVAPGKAAACASCYGIPSA